MTQHLNNMWKVTRSLGTGSSDATWDGSKIILGQNDISRAHKLNRIVMLPVSGATLTVGRYSKDSIQNRRMCFRKSMKEV